MFAKVAFFSLSLFWLSHSASAQEMKPKLENVPVISIDVVSREAGSRANNLKYPVTVRHEASKRAALESLKHIVEVEMKRQIISADCLETETSDDLYQINEDFYAKQLKTHCSVFFL